MADKRTKKNYSSKPTSQRSKKGSSSPPTTEDHKKIGFPCRTKLHVTDSLPKDRMDTIYVRNHPMSAEPSTSFQKPDLGTASMPMNTKHHAKKTTNKSSERQNLNGLELPKTNKPVKKNHIKKTSFQKPDLGTASMPMNTKHHAKKTTNRSSERQTLTGSELPKTNKPVKKNHIKKTGNKFPKQENVNVSKLPKPIKHVQPNVLKKIQ